MVAVLLFKIQSLFSWLKKDVFLFIKHTEEVAATFTFITHEKSKKKKKQEWKYVKIPKLSVSLAEITRWNIMTGAVIYFTLVESKPSGLGELCFSYCSKTFQGHLIHHSIFPGTTSTPVADWGRVQFVHWVDRSIVVYKICLIRNKRLSQRSNYKNINSEYWKGIARFTFPRNLSDVLNTICVKWI